MTEWKAEVKIEFFDDAGAPEFPMLAPAGE
jgi:hypothetical protein